MTRMAAHHMYIDGQKYTNHVVELDEQGNIVSHYQLTQELPHTTWHQSLQFNTKKGG